MKSGNFMQNTGIVRIAVMWSKSKPEEVFQYGGRLFLQNGKSYISAMDWVILTICRMLIDTDLLKKCDTKVKLCHSGRHLEYRQDVIISAASDPILVKCGTLTQNDMTIMAMRSKSKLKKMTDWKRQNCSLVVQVISPEYSNVRACVFAGVVQLHNLLKSK